MWYLLPIGTTSNEASSALTFDAANPASFGEAIRASRRAQGLTQLDLADGIGVHRRVIGELERGKPTVRLEIALAAAAALGLDTRLHPRR